MNGITVHMMIRNEEEFIRQAIESVLPVAEEVIVFDTGSTDNTAAIVKGIKSEKIMFFEKGKSEPKRLVELRNEMISLTKTEWFMVIDGDEIIMPQAMEKILSELEALPKNVCRVELTMRDFVKDRFLVARDRKMGKLWRTNRIVFLGTYPFEYGAVKSDQQKNLAEFSEGNLSSIVVSYHMCFFRRSSRDADVEIGRHWRKLPFPVLPFFGPWPDGMPGKSNVLFALMKLPFYNCVAFYQKFFHRKEQTKNAKAI